MEATLFSQEKSGLARPLDRAIQRTPLQAASALPALPYIRNIPLFICMSSKWLWKIKLDRLINMWYNTLLTEKLKFKFYKLQKK